MSSTYKNPNILRKLYLNERLSVRKIANKFNVDPQVIWYFLQKFNIPRRPPKHKRKESFKIPKDVLEDLYCKKRLSTNEIAKKIGVKTHKTILIKLIKYGIPRRSKSETSTKYPKKPFSGDLEEKAYLIGLRMGDFSARMHRKLIRLDTAAMKKEQIEMSKQAFGKYTKVCISGKTLYFHLHPSFKFLLKKLKLLPKWILDNKKTFFSFLAGYMDCEGSWSIIPDGIHTISFQFSLSTNSKTILKQINGKLNELGFKAHLYLSRKKGDRTNIGIYKKDLYSLVVYRKDDVIRLIEKLLPLTRHPDKIKRMKLILQIKDKKWNEVKNKVAKVIYND
jgi:predicted DNA-binding protein YlxM (UPF0122 family)